MFQTGGYNVVSSKTRKKYIVAIGDLIASKVPDEDTESLVRQISTTFSSKEFQSEFHSNQYPDAYTIMELMFKYVQKKMEQDKVNIWPRKLVQALNDITQRWKLDYEEWKMLRKTIPPWEIAKMGIRISEKEKKFEVTRKRFPHLIPKGKGVFTKDDIEWFVNFLDVIVLGREVYECFLQHGQKETHIVSKLYSSFGSDAIGYLIEQYCDKPKILSRILNCLDERIGPNEQLKRGIVLLLDLRKDWGERVEVIIQEKPRIMSERFEEAKPLVTTDDSGFAGFQDRHPDAFPFAMFSLVTMIGVSCYLIVALCVQLIFGNLLFLDYILSILGAISIFSLAAWRILTMWNQSHRNKSHIP